MEFEDELRGILGTGYLAKRIDKAHQKAMKQHTVEVLELVKRRIRGEGEPGNAGEMISNNYVDEFLDEAINKEREGLNE